MDHHTQLTDTLNQPKGWRGCCSLVLLGMRDSFTISYKFIKCVYTAGAAFQRIWIYTLKQKTGCPANSFLVIIQHVNCEDLRSY